MLHKYFLINVVLLLQILRSVALPAAPKGNHTNALQPRQCVWNSQTKTWNCDDNLPTMNEIIYHMRNDPSSKANKDHSACFYSELGQFVAGPQGPALWITNWVKKVNMKWYWLYNVLPPQPGNWYPATLAWAKAANSDPARNAYYKKRWGAEPYEVLSLCWYQALSLAAVNPDAYIFTTKEVVTFRTESVWTRIEYPFLTQNPNIQRIWRVDPRPPTEGGKGCGELSDRELYWDRARGDKVIPALWICPVRPLQAATTAATTITAAAAATTS